MTGHPLERVTTVQPRDSATLARFLLSAAAAGGVDARWLAHEAKLPFWALADDAGFIDSRYVTRIWELTDHVLGESDAALSVAGHYRLGALGVYDYLFASAPTLGEGLRACQRYMHLVTTNSRLEVEAGTDGMVTCSFGSARAGDMRTALGQRSAVLMFITRARSAAGRRVWPVRVALAHRAPAAFRNLAEALGTPRIDYDAPVTSFTLRGEDLALPMETTDPVLARILAGYASSMPPPVATWLEHFRGRLTEVMEDGAASMEDVARRLAVSPRTLQRRLAERDTTWRAELDTVRRFRAQQARQSASPTLASLATRLGYSDARSVRRAIRRWERTEPLGAHSAVNAETMSIR